MNEAWREAVLEAVGQACSQEPTQIAAGEAKLKMWETQSGFYTLLMPLEKELSFDHKGAFVIPVIFQNRSLDVNIRWLAILYMKNGVDRYWRKTAPNALSEEEKRFIKQHLTLSFDEPVDQIAIQVAVLISKIVRIETREWPELFPLLLKEVQSSDVLHQQRSLLILNHVVKMLASKRLSPDRKLFREFTSDVFGCVVQLWQNNSALQIEFLNVKDMRILASLELSSLSLKVLRKLIIHGFEEFEPSSEPVCLLQALLNQIGLLLQYRKEATSSQVLMQRLEKYLILLTKLLIDTQEHLPLSFTPLIQPSLELCFRYVFTSQGQDVLFHNFALQCCKLMKGIVHCSWYKPPKEIKEDTSQEVLKAYQIKMAFFTPSVLSEIIHQLVTRFFLMTSQELENWEQDPEDYVREDAGESWKYELRPCTEVLFLSIFNEFRSTVSPLITHMIQLLQGSNTSSDDMAILLQKDAVYMACGLASYDLFDEIDFDKWFTTQLMQELNNLSTGNKVLRRRIIWMTGQWINVKFSRLTRPILYQVLLQVMGAQEDLVVRLTAANTLKTDDVDFYLEDFLQFLEGSLMALFQLLKCVEECDTKMSVLHVLSLLIERIGSKVCPYATTLSQYLPELWQESGAHNMLQCAILSTMTHLVEGLEVSSNTLYPVLLPVIQLSTDTTQSQHVYLMENGLELWHKVMVNASQMTTELLTLFANMPSLLDLGSENLRTCFVIIESYVLFNERQFFQNFGEPLVNAFTQLLGNIKSEGGIVLSRVIETVVKVSPTVGAQCFLPVLMKIFHMILQIEDDTPLLVIYLSILGEIILHNCDFFFNIVGVVSHQLGSPPSDILGKVLDIWLEKLDFMTRLERRKLTVLSLLSLLPLKIEKCITNRFAIIVDASVDVLHEIHRSEEGTHTDCLVLFVENEDNGEHSEEYKRRKKLCLSDPVHRYPLWMFVRDKLTQSQSVYGQETFHQLMECLDSAVAAQLFSFINH